MQEGRIINDVLSAAISSENIKRLYNELIIEEAIWVQKLLLVGRKDGKATDV